MAFLASQSCSRAQTFSTTMHHSPPICRSLLSVFRYHTLIPPMHIFVPSIESLRYYTPPTTIHPPLPYILYSYILSAAIHPLLPYIFYYYIPSAIIHLLLLYIFCLHEQNHQLL